MFKLSTQNRNKFIQKSIDNALNLCYTQFRIILNRRDNMTAQRKLILDIINNSPEHLNAEKIYFSAKTVMPGIAMATVYNSLKYLSDNNYIRKVGVNNGADFYDKSLMPHEHIICDKCGAITDVIKGGIKEIIEKEVGGEITGYELNVHYICDKCKCVN